MLVEVESHYMVLFQVLNFTLLIDELTLLIFQFLLANDPVIVYPFPFFLKICQQFLLLLVGLLELTQLLSYR